MKVSLEKQGPNIVQLGLELGPDKALKAYEVACRSLSHKVNIPGFRKGKAPRHILEKTLGVDYIKQEALESLVPDLLSKAIVEENLDVITQPEISSCQFQLGEPLTLTARFEVRPEVTLGQYQGLSVEVEQAVVPAEALERALNSIAESKASLKPVANRPLSMGDTAVLDFECFVNGKLVEGGKAQGLVLEMKAGNFIEGFCEQLVGQEPGHSTKVKVRFPENYRNLELAGQEAEFAVQVQGIREKAVPDINDDLARSVGQESLDQLKNAINQRLQEDIEQENLARAQRAVVDAVISQAQVEIPETMIQREHGLLLGQFKQVVEQNQQNWESFKESPEFPQLSETKLKEARQRVLTSLVLGAVVRAQKMSVGREEVAPYLAELAGQYNVAIEKVAGNEELCRQVMEDVLTRKVVEYLVSQSQIHYGQKPLEEAAKSDKA